MYLLLKIFFINNIDAILLKSHKMVQKFSMELATKILLPTASAILLAILSFTDEINNEIFYQ